MKLSFTSMTRNFATRETGSWRTERPIIDLEICIVCGRCLEYCPEGIILKEEEKPFIDYLFCKGCGICAYECPKKAINMTTE
jgi:2-oxoacid:acceptor oxidoreductase delta subunit (pyruvate/2-ketoisovalerate family)